MKKFFIIICSVILICILGFCLVWTIINFATVKDSMNGSSIYTYKDIQTAYDEGYSKAIENQSYYDELINKYKTLYEDCTEEITLLNKEIKDLNTQKEKLQEKITNLEILNQNNLELISQLNAQINNLNKQIDSKNNEIQSLENRINEINDNFNIMCDLRNQYIISACNLKNLYVVTYTSEDNNCFYGIEIVEKGGYASMRNFSCVKHTHVIIDDGFDNSSTKSYKIYLNGEEIDLSTYQINENVTFIIK